MTVKNKTRKAPKRRPSYHGQPGLWHRDKKHYYVIWTENGKTRTKSLRTTDFLEAGDRLREFRKQREAGNLTVMKVPTVHEAVDQWLALKQTQVVARTMGDYRYFGNKIRSYFPASMLVTAMTGPHIEDYLLHLIKSGLVPYSVKTQLSALRTVLKRLVRLRLITFNPADGVDFKAKSGRRELWPEPLYKEYLADLLAERDAAKDPRAKLVYQDLHDRAIVLWWSGMRTIEVSRLLWSDIDLEADGGPQWTIRSSPKKGGVTTLPISPILTPLLIDRKERGLEGPFGGRHAVMKLGWAKFKLKYSKYGKYDHHCMRHSFVTRIAARDGREIAAILARHSSIEMSQRYDHRSIAGLREVLTKDSVAS